MDRLLSFGEGRTLKKLQRIAGEINQIEPDFQRMSDDELVGQTADFKQRIDNGESLDSILPEAFATVREASVRVLGKRHFDVQLVGGAALHLGNIAEMKTGEGKTLVATLPSYLNALAGKGVHVVTVNDYLAKYQSEWMGRLHHFLGLNVGSILSNMAQDARRQAYQADITYGTNNEFGFDYLRDNMSLQLSNCVQRGHYFAIVDEVDSILIDEARTPLIISGPAAENKQWYPVFARLATRLRRDVDYEVDEKKRTVSILAPGIEKAEDLLGIDNLYESANTPLIGYLNNSIKAKELFKRDKDYIVAQGEVLIVDEHTGRTLIGRRYNEGLHQSLEAKEGVEIKDEYQTLATITLQNYFRMYEKLAGMTGTAKTEESEFQKIYGLSVIEIPTNMPMIRIDQSDLIYRTEQAKFEAIVADVVDRHEKGQPVLLGTASVEKSELLSALLKRAGVAHQVLNAKYHEQEAAVVALAGRKGAVTVATNMAGRGTDIMLGGNAEFLADADLRRRDIDPIEEPELYEKEYGPALKMFEEQTKTEHDEVTELGGLYVIGSERHESRRIDNQLRGRSGRQGDPGESRFYLSLEDDLMRLFKSELVARAMTTMNLPDDVPIETKLITRSIESAQKQVEAQNFEIRKNVLRYDDVMNRQRHAIYKDRRRILEGEDVESTLRGLVEKVVSGVVAVNTEGLLEDWDLDVLWTQMRTLYPVTLDIDDYYGVERDELIQAFVEDANTAYDRREEALGEENMREFERQVMLTVLDRKWREHLYEMDYLREGIGLRAYAQRDPLVEYQNEGGQMYDAMYAAFEEEVVGYLFNLEVRVNRPEPQQPTLSVGDESTDLSADSLAAALKQRREAELGSVQDESAQVGSLQVAGLKQREETNLSYSAPDESGAAVKDTKSRSEKSAFAGVGRNQKCPCGSGKKFKVCHGANR